MDFWGALMLFIVLFLIMSCCGFCCRSKRRCTVLSTPVVVTSTTHAVSTNYPAQTGNFQTAYVPPYPGQTSVTMQMPMPMPNQAPPVGAQVPYPIGYPMPMPPAGTTMNPPSYDAAVGAATAVPINSTPTYEKQAPYNPNFVA